MGNAPVNNVGLLHVIANGPQLAGGSMTTDRTSTENRFQGVNNGRYVGKTTIDFALTSVGTPRGYYEYCVVKYQRQFTVPAIGTDPVPSSAVIITDGLQNACRSLAPGYVIKFGTIPVTAETTVTRKIVINWAKFGKAIMRDGDFFTIVFFNRSDSTNTYDLQIRYTTYNVS